jgi:hypothetical protein
MVRASGSAGLVNFGRRFELPPAYCDASGRCGSDDYVAGWTPLVSLAGGVDLPLPLRSALRAEVAADVPVRVAGDPGGGAPVYLRWGLGLTFRL